MSNSYSLQYLRNRHDVLARRHRVLCSKLAHKHLTAERRAELELQLTDVERRMSAVERRLAETDNAEAL